MRRLIFLMAILLLFIGCHWGRSWRWEALSRKAGEVLPVTVRPPDGGAHNSWTPVLSDLLSRRRDVRLTNVGWRYGLWIDVAEGYMSLICYEKGGRIVGLATVGSDRFVDREQGVGKTEGAANIIQALQQELDRLFREGKGATDAK